MAYRRPMVTVDQNMTTTPTAVESEQPAFIFGPHYELHRYSDPDEKPGTAAGIYDGGPRTVEYPNVVNPEKVDENYTKLVGDNVAVGVFGGQINGLAALPETLMPGRYIESNGGYTILSVSGPWVNYDVNGDPVAQLVEGLKRGVVKGDHVVVSYNTEGEAVTVAPHKLLTKVAKIEYKADAWSIDSSDSPETSANSTLIYIEDAIPMDVDPDRVCVTLVEILDGVYFDRKTNDGSNPWQWECVDDGVEIYQLLAHVPSYFGNDEDYGTVMYAELYVTYRELKDSFTDSFHSVVGASSVRTLLGAIDPDNPLAQGVWNAALNAATDDGDEAPPVYFMAVETDDLAGYEKVLTKATLNDRAYVFSPTTSDGAVIEAVRSHVDSMSTKTVKKWRIGVVSEKVPEVVQRIGPSASPHGNPYYALPISTDNGETYTQFRITVSSTDSDPNEEVDLRDGNKLVEGDIVMFGFSNGPWGETYNTYTVKKVINRYTVEVKEPITGATTSTKAGQSNSVSPSRIEAYHKYTPMEQAEQVALTSKRLASRRIVNVFPDYFEFEGVGQGGEFAACAVAGLISATEPQQPITNMSIRGIDNVPATHSSNYSSADLDLIASGGTLIVAQDLPDDLVYVRHQITTAYKDGNLNTAELSITKDVDSISYAFADTFRPYNGKYNIMPELVAILENLAGSLISQLGGSTSVYGPQLIAENTRIKYVRQNALLKDHVDVAISVAVPYPCNNIDIVLTV